MNIFFITLGPGMAIFSLLLNSICDNGLYRFRRNKCQFVNIHVYHADAQTRLRLTCSWMRLVSKHNVLARFIF